MARVFETSPNFKTSILLNGSAGNSGQALVSTGAGTVPQWSDIVTPTGTQTLTNKTFSDSTTFFQDETDNTKKLQFELSGITTGNTRVLTIPNSSGTIALTSDIPSILPVGNGGTGRNTLTVNGVLYGDGTNAVGMTSAPTWDSTNGVGQILSNNSSGNPVWTDTIDCGTF